MFLIRLLIFGCTKNIFIFIDNKFLTSQGKTWLKQFTPYFIVQCIFFLLRPNKNSLMNFRCQNLWNLRYTYTIFHLSQQRGYMYIDAGVRSWEYAMFAPRSKTYNLIIIQSLPQPPQMRTLVLAHYQFLYTICMNFHKCFDTKVNFHSFNFVAPFISLRY